MELSIEEAVQQGINEYKLGNLQEAERLYNAVLEIQPEHPDANHNLGLIAISKNQPALAVPLFKKALELNPNIERFWFNYIDGLIKNNQFKDAKRLIKKAKKRGLDNKQLRILLSQTKISANSKLSPEAQDYNLVEYYQAGQFSNAEKLALSIIENSPKHLLGWKVLGAIYGQTGRGFDSLKANQKAVEINPQDAESYYNLGVSLQALDRLDEAKESYNQAIAFQFDFSEAHSNLGEILLKEGRHREGLKEKLLGDGVVTFDLKNGLSI